MFKSRKIMLKVASIVGALALFLYLLAAFIVFDMGKPAYAYDEETHNGREVALGPRPRTWACKPTHHDVGFDGHEWPFKVFRPICGIWRVTKGYETPAELRRQ